MLLTTRETATVHETPNAVMRTLAAPSRGATELAVWEVSMRAGQRGPEHVASREQVWTVLEGELKVHVGEEHHAACEGGTLRIPPEVPRQVAAETNARALVASRAGCSVTTSEGGERPLPWAV
jgi:quercetin dioxygenase-like cupin family protein